MSTAGFLLFMEVWRWVPFLKHLYFLSQSDTISQIDSIYKGDSP
jgi:hypothetical protein